MIKVNLFNITPNAEKLIEYAARTCYDSHNISNVSLIEKLIASGHDSPLEHAYATFDIQGVSRALTHQLVRHRLCSFSQKSQRYVKEEEFSYVIPSSIVEKGLQKEFEDDMEIIRNMYKKWKNHKIRHEDARFVLPNACSTHIVMSANFRQYRNIFKLRLKKNAQWEIRVLCEKMLDILYGKSPLVFGDIKKKFYNKKNEGV